MEEKNTYTRLSDEQRKKNIQRTTAYNRDKAVRITLKATKYNFTDIEEYMNKAIDSGAAKSKNDFILSAVRYAISNDFLECDGGN